MASHFAQDDGLDWGHVVDGLWHILPKTPMLLADLGPPPFEVQLPDGRVRLVVHRPAMVAAHELIKRLGG